MLALLKNRNFRLLWLGQLSSQCGDRLTQLLLVALAAARASGSTMSLAKVLALTSLPALLISPFAGAYVDRWDRKRTMIICDLIRAGTILALPFLAQVPNQFSFYLAIFTLFALSSFFVPARLAMIPDLVSRSRLAKANALFTTSGMTGAALILLVGALLVEWVGTTRTSWANAAGYLTSACFIALIVRRHRGRRQRGETAKKIFHQIVEGIQELWLHRSTRWIIGLLGLLMAGAGASIVAGTVLVQQSLGSVTKDLGFLGLWLGWGMLTGALAYGRWATRWPHKLVLGITFVGCSVALLFFVAAVAGFESRALASLAVAFLGFFITPAGIVTNTLIHEAHPERLHGRIFSSLGVVVNASLIAAMLGGGSMAERWGEAMVLGVVGGSFALAGIALLYYTGRTHLRLTSR